MSTPPRTTRAGGTCTPGCVHVYSSTYDSSGGHVHTRLRTCLLLHVRLERGARAHKVAYMSTPPRTTRAGARAHKVAYMSTPPRTTRAGGTCTQGCVHIYSSTYDSSGGHVHTRLRTCLLLHVRLE